MRPVTKFTGKLGQPLGAGSVKNDGGTTGMKGTCDGRPDSAAGAGDQRNIARQIKHGEFLSSNDISQQKTAWPDVARLQLCQDRIQIIRPVQIDDRDIFQRALDQAGQHFSGAKLDKPGHAFRLRGQQGFTPAHAACDLRDKIGAKLAGIGFTGSCHVAEHRHRGICHISILQGRRHGLGGRLHHRAMERSADRQLDGTANATRLGSLDGVIDSRSGATDDDLTQGVVIGKLDNPGGRGFGDNVVNHRFISPQNGSHSAVTWWNRALHTVAAKPQQLCRIAGGKRSGSRQRGIFTKRMTGNEIRHLMNRLAGGLAQHSDSCHRCGEQGRLGVSGQPQILFRTVLHQREQILVKRLIHLIKDGAGSRERIRKRTAHTDRLRSLPRKLEKYFACHLMLPLKCPAYMPRHRPIEWRGAIPQLCGHVNDGGFWRNYAETTPAASMTIRLHLRRLRVCSSLHRIGPWPGDTYITETILAGKPVGLSPPRQTMSQKEIRMRLYESVFIARQDISSSQVESMADEFAGIITNAGGKIHKREYWGLRSLAYRIKKNRKGHYIMFNLETDGETLKEYERIMRLNEDVLRFLNIRIEEVDENPSIIMQNKGERGERGDRGDRGDRGSRPPRQEAKPAEAASEEAKSEE